MNLVKRVAEKYLKQLSFASFFARQIGTQIEQKEKHLDKKKSITLQVEKTRYFSSAHS